MKKLATLLLAAGLVFCGVTGASAVDFKAKGQWIMNFEYGHGASGYTENNGNKEYGYNGSEDNFEAKQRIRLQLHAIASESLSGTVYFEIGNTTWGDAEQGGALGADGKIVEVKQAYLDWIVPNSELKVRMGLQALGLPSFTGGTSEVFVEDVAGVVLSNKFSENVSATLFWARPYNDNYENKANTNLGTVTLTDGLFDDSNNYLDNIDAFGLVVPLTFDGVKAVPWVTYTFVGRNAVIEGYLDSVAGGDNVLSNWSQVANGLLPVGFTHSAGSLKNIENINGMLPYGNVWHAGLTGEVTAGDPFRIAWDLNYGSANFGEEYLQRYGFYGALLAEYKMDWGTPGLYFWYSSGDDDDPDNGSERMPTIATGGGTNEFSSFASSGDPYIGRDNVIGSTLVGTWGIGARVKDFSFMEDLTHTFRINYYGGTNDPDMAGAAGSFDSGYGLYFTEDDWALEFSLENEYQIYDNLVLYVQAAYLMLDFDKSTWQHGDASNHRGTMNYEATDAFNINASFVYSF